VRYIGGATAQVTQPSLPCFKLGLHFKEPQVLREILRSSRSGWYLRVLERSLAEAGASIARIGSRNPTWSVARLNHLLGSHATVEEISELRSSQGALPDFATTRVPQLRLHPERTKGTARNRIRENELTLRWTSIDLTRGVVSLSGCATKKGRARAFSLKRFAEIGAFNRPDGTRGQMRLNAPGASFPLFP
jgi:hypothetical protein